MSILSGGGASDVRLVGGEWDNFTSLKSRIIDAGGGAGGDGTSVAGIYDKGGSAGGLNGFASNYSRGKGGTQTNGGEGDVNGKFGKGGGNGKTGDGSTTFPNGNGAGGGGYFGGGGSTSDGSYGGGGGSSYISGYNGCNSIDNELSTNEDNIVMLNKSIHYSGHRFFMMDMIDGNSLMPSPNGGNETGHSGFGAIRITLCKDRAATCLLELHEAKFLLYIMTICFLYQD